MRTMTTAFGGGEGGGRRRQGVEIVQMGSKGGAIDEDTTNVHGDIHHQHQQ